MDKNKIINDFSPLLAKQCFTKNHSRFSDTSICGRLDDLEILRPSMANGIITKILVARNYIDINKGYITVTKLGMDVSNFLVESEFNFIDFQFTANMELELDKISNGDSSKLELLESFWASLQEGIEKGKAIKDKKQETKYTCPLCGSPVLLKHSIYGSFFSCSKYSKKEDGCKYKANVDEDGNLKEKEIVEKEYADFKCNQCGSKMIKRKSKYGEFMGCSKFPTCKATADLNGTFKDPKKKKFKSYKKKKHD